jgi:putative membrane protein
MIPLSEFPAIDATLNATTARLLTLGYFFIRRKRIQAHNVCMLSAFATPSLFLLCYIWYHAHHGVTRFPGQGAVSDLYLGAARFAHERHKKPLAGHSLCGSMSLLFALVA